MKIGCVIMAAGAARRFGSDKLLQPLAGRPVLAHTLAALPRSCLDRVVAVTRSDSAADLCRQSGVHTLVYDGGPQSQTVRLGIGQMGGMDGCIFLLGDQPLCTQGSIRAVIDEFQRYPGCVIRLAYGGNGGSPVIFPARLFDGLAALTGDRGGMTAARRAGAEIRLVEAARPQELWDIDTPEALARAEDFLRQGGKF